MFPVAVNAEGTWICLRTGTEFAKQYPGAEERVRKQCVRMKIPFQYAFMVRCANPMCTLLAQPGKQQWYVKDKTGMYSLSAPMGPNGPLGFCCSNCIAWVVDPTYRNNAKQRSP